MKKQQNVFDEEYAIKPDLWVEIESSGNLIYHVEANGANARKEFMRQAKAYQAQFKEIQAKIKAEKRRRQELL